MKCDKCLRETTKVIRLEMIVLSYEHDGAPGEPALATYQNKNGLAYCTDCASIELDGLVGKFINNLSEATRHI